MSANDREAADRQFMTRALALAEQGLFTTSPNPRVGCVIAAADGIIGEGWHARAGAPHAEIEALRDAANRGHDVRGATLYVTLEPCNHVGRTGPCTEAVLRSGVRRVVAAMADPNRIATGGAAKLRAAGVEVETGVLEQHARALNPGFVCRIERGRPFVRLKVAITLDGRTATDEGASQWITGQPARDDGHAWRARACAVLTGVGTVLADNPRMTVRAVATSRQPLRVVVDRHGDTPAEANVLRGGALIVGSGIRNASWPADVEHLSLPDKDGRVDLPALMHALAQRELNEVHVEAGARLNAALLDDRLVDELLIYVAPSVLGDPARGLALFPAARGLEERWRCSFESVDRIGGDLRIRASVVD
ncbi:MAG TPA: bifunctional diaminohydroxyphosphoribosylaminopyrimidine deaminase/5-amino-6-(5-phosphoribosylamino)uracil reductase RibD [Casimicrobiaceae bacterium]|nr:bifunctional diaminohydroxyphosphoribosylaminopyrimidine deaminase/5-amino-6-(5-phosphoribosylamino)uracil reductase RibD [Casimicrobiaceae bacterium]